MNDLHDTFEAALIADEMQLKRKRMEWWRQRAVGSGREGCIFCSTCLDSNAPGERVHYLLPPELGGPHIEENLVPACTACWSKKRNRDWQDWGRALSKSDGDELAKRRQVVLPLSANHLLASREVARTKPYVLTLLQQRWAHPRFAIRAALTADAGLLGITKNDRLPDEAVLRIRLSGGQPTHSTPLIFAVPPARFHDLVWQFIEQNAWVRRLGLGSEFPDPTPPADAISRWHETFTSVGDIHRRREQLAWVHPAKRLPRHERPMDPRDRLQLAGLLALKTGHPIDREWLARHREADEGYASERKRKIDQAWLTRHAG